MVRINRLTHQDSQGRQDDEQLKNTKYDQSLLSCVSRGVIVRCRLGGRVPEFEYRPGEVVTGVNNHEGGRGNGSSTNRRALGGCSSASLRFGVLTGGEKGSI